jgi:glycosyltransferase involved in cell wall biosynthesis
VLHVLAPGPVGGLEGVVSTLTTGLRAAGVDARVAAVLDSGAGDVPYVEELRGQGVPVDAIELPPRAYAAERRWIAARVRTLTPAVVHTHGYRADIQAGYVARRMGVPTATTVHGFTGGGWKNRLYEHVQRLAMRRFDAVIAVSKPLQRELAASGVQLARIHLIPNAAPPGTEVLDRAAARRALAASDGEFVLGWVGRLSWEKGPDVLIDALGQLPQDVVAVIIGTGRAAAQLSERAATRGVNGRIRWAGLVPHAGRLFTGFDCFVLSSRTEGTPLVLFEAMAAGAPIVATAVGGVPDVVSAQEAILVAQPDPAALAAGIAALRADPAGARARAAAAERRVVRERALAPWIARYQEVYDAVTAASRGASR